ncbi:MAG: EamA family transporter [Betaproteobacteria bacterium]|nr:EamA family transporter [Betaproteobacteria bacterium]
MNFWADIIALLAAMCWAGANTFIARGSSHQGGDNGAFLSILMTVLIAGVVWLIGGGTDRQLLNLEGLAWFVIAGALTIFVGRVFFHSSVQYMGAVRSSSVKRLVPLFSVLLGVLCLGESLNLSALVGMALIFAGFGVLVWESKQKMTPMDSLATDQGPYRKTMRLGMVYGVVSAGAYATGNMSRKFGLLHIPEPAFGAMMGALVGAILFVTSALFLQSYREAVKNTLQKPNPWLLSAGLLASAGQLLYFVAIDLSSLSRATLIVSMDVFLTILVALVFFQKREAVNRYALVAAALGVLGTGVIIGGAD